MTSSFADGPSSFTECPSAFTDCPSAFTDCPSAFTDCHCGLDPQSISHLPIGIFDSGIGGLSILRALRAQLPREHFVYLSDDGFAPYGERTDAYVIERSRAIAQRLRDEHAIKLLVVACNTATAAAVHLLRAEHADMNVVGVEPGLKPAAAHSSTRRIGVMTTRGTLSSGKLRALQADVTAQSDVQFTLQACDGLADAIQCGDAAQVQALCERYTAAMGAFGDQPGQIDTLVLGCTHYPFAQAQLQSLVGPRVRIIETGQAVARQTQRLLRAAELLSGEVTGTVRLLSTGAPAELERAAQRWLFSAAIAASRPR